MGDDLLRIAQVAPAVAEVREALVAFLRENHPESLPRVRAEVGALTPFAAA